MYRLDRELDDVDDELCGTAWTLQLNLDLLPPPDEMLLETIGVEPSND